MTKETKQKKSATLADDAVSPVESVASPDTKKIHKKWRIDRMFWGLLLVLFGILALVDNFGFVDVHWTNVWRLWPVAIIAAGLSVLSLQNRFWKIMSAILVVATLAAVALVAVVDYSDQRVNGTYETTVTQSSNDVQSADVTIQAGASVLQVRTADQRAIADVKLQSDLAKLVHTSTTDNSIQHLNFSMDSSNRWWGGDVRSKWDATLTRDLPLRVKIEAGASDTNVDLSLAQLQSLTVKAGASSLDLKVGNRQDTVTVSIDSGVSSVVLRVPNNSGVRLVLDGGLTTKRLADLNDIGNNTYETSGYAQATKKITIGAKIGVATFAIERY